MKQDVDLTSMRGATMTVTVHVTRRFRWRVAVGLWLIRFGARVTGMGVDVVRSEEQ